MDILIDTLTRYQEYDDAFTIEIEEAKAINHSNIYNNDLIRIQKEYADTDTDIINHSNIYHNNDLIRIQKEYADTDTDIDDEYNIQNKQTVTKPTIRNCLITLFQMENIKTKNDLYKWNGNDGMNKLHSRIKQMAPYHYNHIKTPKSSISYCIQTLLDGYKIYKK